MSIIPAEINNQSVGSLPVISDGSVMEMANKLEEMKQRLQLVKRFFKEVMEKDVDYGIIPGTDKPALYQPGADKINALYNFSKVIAGKEENKDYNTGHYDATVKVRLVHRGTGVMIAEGEGSCSTRESKYHYRWVYERDIPKGINPTDLVSKDYENKTTGAKWTKYRIENEDLYSLWNTVLKMATKRAYVAATLAGTGLSGIFSQEEDEMDAWIEGESAREVPELQPQINNKGSAIDKKDLSVTVSFGRFKGKNLGHILDEDPTYLEWLSNNAQAEKVRKACANILNAINNQQPFMAEEPLHQVSTGNGYPSAQDEAELNALFPGGEPI